MSTPPFSAMTTPTSSKAWAMDVQGFAPDSAIPEALINTITTIAGNVEGDAVAVRVPVVNDDAANIVPEGDQIPEADPELSEAVVITTKVAKLMRISREQFEQPNAAAMLSQAAARSIVAKADAVLLTQAAPTAPAVTPPAGLLNQGITSAGAVEDSLDVLIDAMAAIQGNGGHPSHVVLSPAAWASLRKLKTATGSNMGILGVGADDAAPRLLGVPVLINAAVTSGSGLIVDRSDIVSAAGQVLVTQSDQAYFRHDSIGLRITFRFGARVVHPTRHATFTVVDSDD